MHFLAIVASERRNGNSDIIGRLSVRYALKSGVDSGEVAHLKNFRLEQCRGCLQCIGENKKCVLDDDLYRLLDIIMEADRLLIIAPVYVLGIPGKLKMLLDRYLAIAGYVNTGTAGPGASIGVAALPDLHQFQIPFTNLMLLAVGRRIAGSTVLYGAGPGEVLLNGSIAGLSELIDKLVHFRNEPFDSTVEQKCPVDHSSVFERIGGDRFRCPICLTPARLTDRGYYFDASDLNKYRWTGKSLQEHFENWVLQTKPRFKSMLKDIVRKKKEMGI
jgi:multimeric flavodoxin WrbA